MWEFTDSVADELDDYREVRVDGASLRSQSQSKDELDDSREVGQYARALVESLDTDYDGDVALASLDQASADQCRESTGVTMTREPV